MKRSWFVGYIIMSLLVLIINFGSKVEAQDVISITLYFPSWIDPNDSVLSSIANDFQSQYPNVSVEIVINPDYYQVLPTMFAAGEAPDGIIVDADFLQFDVYDGWVIPIDEYYQENPLGEFESSITGFTVDGSLYGIPFFNMPAVTIYNVDALEQVGFGSFAEIPITGSDGEIGLDTIILGLESIPMRTAVSRDLTVASSFVRSSGAESDIFHNPNFNAWAAAIDSQSILQDVFSPQSVYSPENRQQLAENFASGDTGLALDSTFTLRQIRDQSSDQNLGIAFVPYIDQQYTIAHAFAGAVTPSAENPQTVVDFFQFLAGHSSFVAQTLSRGGLPSHEVGFGILFENPEIVSEALMPSLTDDLETLYAIAQSADQAQGSAELGLGGYQAVLNAGTDAVYRFIDLKQDLLTASTDLIQAIQEAQDEG